MSVRILYFARLREALGRASEELELPIGVTTVAGLRNHLIDRGGEWAGALREGKALRVAVNQEIAESATPLKSGDEIAFFPPVTGG